MKNCVTCGETDADVCRSCMIKTVGSEDPALWYPKPEEPKLKTKRKRQWYYVNGYVQRTNLMAKKKARKKYGSIFKTFKQAENSRLAGILVG